MRKASYVNDWGLLAKATVERNFSLISNSIEEQVNSLNWYKRKNNELYGFRVEKTPQLTDVFNFKTYMINFFFKNVFFDFDITNKNIYTELVHQLNNHIEKHTGYYILRVPTSNVNLIDSINNYLKDFLFCGSSVIYLCNSKKNDLVLNDGISIELGDEKEVSLHRASLLEIGLKSFESYFGQYHISKTTRDKAPKLYENWTREYIEENRGKIIFAKDDNKIVGFLACEETENSFEMVLSAVHENYRGRKIYERMIRKGTYMAIEKGKIATLATQINNYPVQRAWINIGFKPYFSFYMMHINSLSSEMDEFG